VTLFRTVLALCWLLAVPAGRAGVIRCADDAPAQVKLAASEVRRYVFLRTGELLKISSDRPDASDTSDSGIVLKIDPALAAQQYRLKTDGGALSIGGGSPIAVLYGAYAFAEKLGVRFEIDGDVLPDAQIPYALPQLDETRQPLFALRGLQPFHDFPEGPDWWSADQWLSVVGQAAKMRMNFIGLHTYPFHNKDLGPEPTVWVGLPEDVNPDGTVKVSPETTWYNTAKFMPYGCYSPGKTSSFSFGGDRIFPTDDYGPELNGPDDFPLPKTPEASVAMADRCGRMLKTIFESAHRLGIKTCVGTESPLDIPEVVRARMKEQGLDEKDPAALQKLYEGMFLRIQRAYPIDYYWIWGHEGEIDQQRFVANIGAAHAALKSLGSPFGLGICGWGWITGNFPMLHKALSADVVFSAISMSTGHALVSPNFGALGDRAKWAIPWFEDDGALASIQLRAGRMRRDAVDARGYGCDGLFGLHWRTRVIAPNISALARAAWEQGAWSHPAAAAEEKRDVTVIGGQTAAFLNHDVSGTDVGPVYQTVRYDLRGYRFAVSNGAYRVTLRFGEPAYQEAGKRVFGVKLQDKEVIKDLDVFARVGPFAALDYTFDDIEVVGGELRVDFVKVVEFPCVAAIEVAGSGGTRKINCGGPAWQDYEADAKAETLPRDLPVDDFYEDWATAQFGPQAGPAAGKIFSRLDGKFPVPSGWNRGPGVVGINRQPWEKVGPSYAFVDDMAALRPQVAGAGNLARFDGWLDTFRFNRSMARVGCLRGQLDGVMQQVGGETNEQARARLAREKALPLRIELVQELGAMVGHLLASLHNATELGTLANVELQSMLRTKLLVAQDAALEKALGEPLPPEARPWKDYRGPPRLVNLAVRTAAAAGESLRLRIVALDAKPVASVTVRIRPLGAGPWTALPARHVARSVFEAELPAANGDFEYHVVAATAGGAGLVWPATAPALNQTVVVEPKG
jgi:hypothetical protein